MICHEGFALHFGMLGMPAVSCKAESSSNPFPEALVANVQSWLGSPKPGKQMVLLFFLKYCLIAVIGKALLCED